MRLIFLLIFIIIMLILCVRHLERTSIFFPSREIIATPMDVGIFFEDVLIQTEDGLGLHGWFVKAKAPQGTLLFMHGNAGNISGRLEKIKLFYEMGLNVLIFDYRGFGKSEGSATEAGMYIDATAAYDYLKGRTDIEQDKIIAYGASLGGVAVINVASKRTFSHLIIDSSFTNAVDMAKHVFPIIPSFLVKTRLDSLTKIKHIDAPKLFFHSREDQTVPFDLGWKLFEAAKGPKEFVEIIGSHMGGHVYSREEFVREITQFLELY
ncbi:hypothetical protein MNBD_UNCLBAC01-88 [hydrothermal vent metagenome]|uniref:Serine aminopeptidase S33 domain-containing protein n=1 Tax=hydrothermal vent metagenome TaxID=652676 RepID=A0A3B1D315_9ZZZZ